MEITSTPAESSFFRALALLNCKRDFIFTDISSLDIPPKMLRGGLKTYSREKRKKNTVFVKKGVEIEAFDGNNSKLFKFFENYQHTYKKYCIYFIVLKKCSSRDTIPLPARCFATLSNAPCYFLNFLWCVHTALNQKNQFNTTLKPK